MFWIKGGVCLHPITEGIQRTAVCCYKKTIRSKVLLLFGGPFFVLLQEFQIGVVFLEILFEVITMELETLSMVLRQKSEAETIRKNCKMCGKVTIFTDTTIRRHNANGKNIYQFAIYKCSKNHTWNKKLDIYKSYTEHVDPESIIPTEFETITETEKFSIQTLKEQPAIQFKVTVVEGSFRLDQALASHIEGLSRTEITRKIKNGTILLNNEQTKPSQKVYVNDNIIIVQTN